MSNEWVEVCDADEIEVEDVIRFDHGDRSFAVYRTAKGEYHATDGFCTHRHYHLADGFVMGDLIECPKHNGRFDIPTGEPRRKPVCEAIQTYPVKVEDDTVYIQI